VVRLSLVVVVVAWEILEWMRSFAAALHWMTAKGGWMTVLVLRRRFALEPLSDEVAWSKAVAEPPHSNSSGRGVSSLGGGLAATRCPVLFATELFWLDGVEFGGYLGSGGLVN